MTTTPTTLAECEAVFANVPPVLLDDVYRATYRDVAEALGVDRLPFDVGLNLSEAHRRAWERHPLDKKSSGTSEPKREARDLIPAPFRPGDVTSHTCRACAEDKPVKAFPTTRGGKDERLDVCRPCLAADRESRKKA